MKTKRLILAGVLIGASGALACGPEAPGARSATAGPPADVTVSRGVWAGATQSFPATLVSAEEAVVATRMSGAVREVRVDVGSRVRAGQVLVVLDDADIRARLGAAEAGVALAERSLQRVENLNADGAASDQELDQARAAAEVARAAFGDARAQLAYSEVTAPFDGFVVSRTVDPGDLTAPGRPLLRLAGASGQNVEADLPAEMSGAVREGDPVTVSVPGAGARVAARVSRVVPALTPGSRRFRVVAVFDGAAPTASGFVPGAYARLELATAGQGSAWIPADAVVERGQLTGVYTVEESELRLRWLRLGRRVEDAVEVLAGPATELVVVRGPAADLRDGRAVGAVTEAEWAGPGGGEALP
jgi:RND family efflux transporter MFP subunit